MPTSARKLPSRQAKKGDGTTALVPLEETALLTETIEPSQPKTRGQKRTNNTKRKCDTSDAEAAPGKKMKSAQVKSIPTAKKINTKIKATPTVEPRDISKPRPKRTSAQVAADKAEKDKARRQLEELDNETKVMLARMELDQEHSDAERDAKAIRRLSDMVQKGVDSDSSDGDSEDFAMDVDDESESESADSEPVAKKKSVKELREEIDNLKAKLRGGKSQHKSDEGGMKSFTVPNAAKRTPYASGLVPGWKKKTRHNAKLEVETIGGLNDVDASGKRPNVKTKRSQPDKAATIANAGFNGRDFSRGNQDIMLVPDSDTSDSDQDRHPAPPLKPTKSTKQSGTPQNNLPAKTSKNTCAKPEQKSKKCQAVDAPKPVKSLVAAKARITDLPEFTQVQSRWKKWFIPTLYDTFFASEKPFDHFVASSTQFVNFVQGIVNLVYDDVNYEVKGSDPIHLLAYNRINEKRSSIGKEAIRVVEDHLKSLGDKEEIKQWCQWAKRVDGPIFFRTPTPPTCPTSRNHPDYIKPDGRMQSVFVIKLAKFFLRFREGSVGDFGHPKGLFSLILAALERAVCAYTNGVRKDAGEFSGGLCGEKVVGYMRSCSSIDDRCWKVILEACGSASNSQSHASENELADLSLLEQNRGTLFDFSSLFKA